MDAADAFWAASIASRFSDDMIKAIVDTGELSDPDAARYLTDVIIRRRDKVVAYWIGQTNPLDRFAVGPDMRPAPSSTFDNAAIRLRVAQPGATYKARWLAFDNAQGSALLVGEELDLTQHAGRRSQRALGSGRHHRLPVRERIDQDDRGESSELGASGPRDPPRARRCHRRRWNRTTHTQRPRKMNAVYRTLEEIKAIADAVVDEEHDCAAIMVSQPGRTRRIRRNRRRVAAVQLAGAGDDDRCSPGPDRSSSAGTYFEETAYEAARSTTRRQ